MVFYSTVNWQSSKFIIEKPFDFDLIADFDHQIQSRKLGNRPRFKLELEVRAWTFNIKFWDFDDIIFDKLSFKRQTIVAWRFEQVQSGHVQSEMSMGKCIKQESIHEKSKNIWNHMGLGFTNKSLTSPYS